jgi:hypothetical protein
MKTEYIFLSLLLISVVLSACNWFENDISGIYKGTVVTGYGDRAATLELEKLQKKEVSVYLFVTTPYCVGEFRGKGLLKDKVITATDRDEDNICTVTLTLNGKKIQTAEQNCMYWHGFQCSFEGKFSK